MTRDASWLFRQLSGTTAESIADDVAQLVKFGDIPRGTRLPPVRDLARLLGVSPATVSSAWQRLRARGIVTGGGRAGITVSGSGATPRPRRYESEAHFGTLPYDLVLAGPDLTLLPDLTAAIARLVAVPGLNTYERVAIAPDLREAAALDWPYPPQSMLAVNGGYEGLMLALQTFLQPGDRVLLEDPVPPRVLDLLDAAQCRVLPVPRDSEGPELERVRELLEHRPSAFLLQPSWHNPTGGRLSARRRDQLAELLSGVDLLVLEDDGYGMLAAPATPLSAVMPSHVYVRSYSKSHGPDLRLAVIEGAAPLIDRIRAFRGFGSGWTSRLLQTTLARLLSDDAVRESVRAAASIYLDRNEALKIALLARGVAVGGTGMCLWVPVPDEHYAVVTLAAHGIAVHSGSRYTAGEGLPHIRLATSCLDPADASFVAQIVALACGER